MKWFPVKLIRVNTLRRWRDEIGASSLTNGAQMTEIHQNIPYAGDDTPFPENGTRLQIQLHSEGDEWFEAIALDRPRKLWCQITLNGEPFIADESNIVAWRLPLENKS